MTVEMSTMMSQNGGYIVWTSRAFGSFGAWVNGYCSMASNVFDGALYPVAGPTHGFDSEQGGDASTDATGKVQHQPRG